MKLISTLLLLLLAAALAAAAERKRYIVTYDENTPNNVIEKAMEDARSAGANITHQYRIIKGFSVDAPTAGADSFIQSLRFGDSSPSVEEDQIVTTQGGDDAN